MTAQTTEGRQSIYGVLLAAGLSRRMGAFKPLLPFGQLTVIESCIDYLRRAGIDNLVVVVGHRGEEIRLQLEKQHVNFADNNDRSSEMGVSIARGVEQVPLSAGAVLIALTDQPAIPHTVVSALVQEWQLGAKIVKPQFGGRGGHPVLVDLEFRDALLNLPSEGGLKSFFDNHAGAVRRVSVDSGLIARDMDTWDDYRSLHEEVFGFSPKIGRDLQPNEKGQGLI